MERKPNKGTAFRAIALSAVLALGARAAAPVEDMGPQSLALQYGLSFRGQGITRSDIPSHETIHSLSLTYAPVFYVSLEAGLGLDRFDVDAVNSVAFRGDYGISPLFGAVFSTPDYFVEWLRFSGGARFLYLNSKDEKGFRYSGLISSPFLGILASPSGYIDIEAGGRMHLMDGSMEGPSGPNQPFANGEDFRGYLSLTVKSPADGAYLTFDMDMSPGLDADWSHGPQEAQVGISFGTILGSRPRSPEPREIPVYFPAYPEMKDKQDQMSKEIE
ncbi:MAG: hypothetical protein JWP91_946 [Fibrobacteres bacterium]|nr:hypothetical protein [Fibrobacterota bacterium]